MDYTGVVRSSYFKVVDDEAYEAFKTHIATDDLKFWEKKMKMVRYCMRLVDTATYMAT